MRRIKAGPVTWHVLDRGSRRLDLFRDDEDRQAYFAILRTALSYSKCLLFAYALMSNHYHMVLFGDSFQLTRCMTRVNHWYSLYHNRRYGLSGAAFEGPYKAFIQKSPYLLARLMAYVMLNPSRAGLRDDAASWLWSSLRCYQGGEGKPPVPVDFDTALSVLDRDPATAGRLFDHVMEDERDYSKHRKPEMPRAADIQLQQFEWLQALATARKSELGGEHPSTVAQYWASIVGIPLRVMTRQPGSPCTRTLRARLTQLRKRANDDPALSRRLSPP